jgi:peptide/nickel transport system ATP-binding protein
MAKILEDVNLYIDQGEKISLVGESGSGKSLTAMAILGVLPSGAKIVKGEILFDGQNLLHLTQKEILKSRIGYIPQYPLTSLSPSHTIMEQMIDYIKYAGSEKTEISMLLPNFLKTLCKKQEKSNTFAKELTDILLRVKLSSPEHVLSSYPFELSGGMNQRVLIATVLSFKPKLLIADEPTSALDVSVAYVVNSLLMEHVRKSKCALLYITHELGIAKTVSERIYVMYSGSIMESGATEDIITSPLHPYTKGLLAAIPKLTKTSFKGIDGRLPSYINPPEGCRFHPRCPYAMPICKKKIPELVEQSRGHSVACHLY